MAKLRNSHMFAGEILFDTWKGNEIKMTTRTAVRKLLYIFLPLTLWWALSTLCNM